MQEIFKNIILYNPSKAYSFFLIGFLVIISIQNIFFYKAYKDKAYLWYSFYTFLIILDQMLLNYRYHIYVSGSDSIFNGLRTIHSAFEWIYNSAYFIFVLEFGGRYLLEEKKANVIKNIIFAMIFLLFILLGIDLIYDTIYVYNGFVKFQVPVLVLLSLYTYVYLFKMKSIIKYYIIIGGGAFTIFSLGALFASLTGSKISWQIFYIGVFIENIFFSMGLAMKQKVLVQEKNASQSALIDQLQQNEELRNDINKKLEEEVLKKTTEVVNLNKKAEQEKLKQLEVEFDKQMVEMKVSALQSQMNPHFIFNSLNSIKLYIIKNDKENAVYYLNKFSKLIRKILTASREKEVSLLDELETLELYANIENIRFKNEIQITIDVEENLNLATIKIPPLILQPFIENAIWHGLSNKKENKKLDIKVNKLNDDFIEIRIKDNGIGREQAEEFKSKRFHKKESIGLNLTQERLESFSKNFKNQFSLIFNDLKKNNTILGTEVVLKLPLN